MTSVWYPVLIIHASQRGILLWPCGSERWARAAHPEKGWNSVKLAQPVSCTSAAPSSELSHPAGVCDAVPLEFLKSAVQPGPGRGNTEPCFLISDGALAKTPSRPPLYLISPPASDVFCCEESSLSSSSSSDPELRSRSLPPFSKLLLELPVEVWDTPNLRARRSGGGGVRTLVPCSFREGKIHKAWTARRRTVGCYTVNKRTNERTNERTSS